MFTTLDEFDRSESESEDPSSQTTSSLSLEEGEVTSSSGGDVSSAVESESDADQGGVSDPEADSVHSTYPEVPKTLNETTRHQGLDPGAHWPKNGPGLNHLTKVQTSGLPSSRSTKRRRHDPVEADDSVAESKYASQDRKRPKKLLRSSPRYLESVRPEEQSDYLPGERNGSDSSPSQPQRPGRASPQRTKLCPPQLTAKASPITTAGVSDEAQQATDRYHTEPDYALQSDPTLTSRLATFIPQIRAANAELLRHSAKTDFQVDNVAADQKRYIEMDLGLGVLKQKSAPREVDGVQIAESDENESDDEQMEPAVPSPTNALKILLGIKPRPAARSGVQEIGDG